MAHPKYRFTVEVTSQSAAQRFRNLLDVMQKMGGWGCSRMLQIDWDGDGSDKLQVLDAVELSAFPHEEQANSPQLEPTFTKEDLNKVTSTGRNIAVLTEGLWPIPRDSKEVKDLKQWLGEARSMLYKERRGMVNETFRTHWLQKLNESRLLPKVDEEGNPITEEEVKLSRTPPLEGADDNNT